MERTKMVVFFLFTFFTTYLSIIIYYICLRIFSIHFFQFTFSFYFLQQCLDVSKKADLHITKRTKKQVDGKKVALCLVCVPRVTCFLLFFLGGGQNTSHFGAQAYTFCCTVRAKNNSLEHRLIFFFGPWRQML